MRHLGHLVSGPPPRPTWVLGVPTLISPTLSVIFLLLMPLPLYRTIGPRSHLVLNRRPCICNPVPYSRRDPLSLHADSRPSSLTVRPFVPMSYEAQRLCPSILYRYFFG